MSKVFEIFKMTRKLVLPFMNIIIFFSVWKTDASVLKTMMTKPRNIKLLKNIKILT